MPLILLIRHGENDYHKKGRLAGRLPGIHLDENGRQQAQKLAEKLKGVPIKAVYSSPMERALETAEPIAQALDLPVVLRQGLLETEIGEWADKTVKSLRREKLWKRIQGTPSLARFPGGESFAECQSRICREIEELCQQHAPQDILVCVSHADPIKLAVAFYLGLSLDSFQRLAVSPASITALAISESGSRLITLNYQLDFTLPKV